MCVGSREESSTSLGYVRVRDLTSDDDLSSCVYVCVCDGDGKLREEVVEVGGGGGVS